MTSYDTHSLTDAEALELAHHPTVIAAEILAAAIAPIGTALRDSLIFDPTEPSGKINLTGAMIELSQAIRAASVGDELLGTPSPVIQAAKIVAAEVKEVLEILFIERGIG